MLGQSSVAQACFDYRDALLGAPDALHFISKISANRAAAPVSAPSDARADAVPTHLLVEHQARRLSDGLLICVSKQAQGLLLLRAEQAQTLVDMQVMGELVVDAGKFAVQSKHLLINGSTLEGRQELRLGDKLSAAGLDVCIELIRVQDHDE